MSWSDIELGAKNVYVDDEYKDCSDRVGENINILLTAHEQVQKLAQIVGTSSDNKRVREQLSGQISKATNLLGETQQTIKRLESITSTSSRDKKQKVKKLATDFEEKFNAPFNLLIQQAKERLELPLNGNVKGKETTEYYRDEDKESLLVRRQEQEFQQLEDDSSFQDSIIKEREREIKDIQVQMIQVNEIFKDLAKLVEDQGEMIDNIQTNISHASANVESAADEVSEANKLGQSARRKYCYLALIVTIIVAVLVGIVVIVVKTKEN